MAEKWDTGHYAIGTPEQLALEDKLSGIYNMSTITTSRGMTAILAVVDTFTAVDDTIVCSTDVYPGTRILLNRLAESGRINLLWFDPLKPLALVRMYPSLVFVETIGNSLRMPVANLNELETIASAKGYSLVVDSTFTPQWRPNEQQKQGDMIIVGSMTKYEQPNDEWMGGRISGTDAVINKLHSSALLRSVPIQLQAAKRYLATIDSTIDRYKQHSEHARQLINACKAQADLKTYYPHDVDHPGFSRIVSEFGNMAGGVFYLDFRTNTRAERFCDLVVSAGRDWHIAPSFGSEDYRVVPFTTDSLYGYAGQNGIVRIAAGRANPKDNLKVFVEALCKTFA